MRLNFGCGADIKKGWLNVDIVDLDGIDMVMDLDKTPYKFGMCSFNEIYADNVIEHLHNFIPVMRELHRILDYGGLLTIIVPHYLSHDCWSHPQHTRGFSIDTFDHFVSGTKRDKLDGRCFDFKFTHINRRYVFEKGRNPINWINYIIEPVANIIPIHYEKSILRIFPPSHIVIELIK